MRVLDNAIADRGSKYAVSGRACRSDAEGRALVAKLCRVKKFAKATYHSWGVLCAEEAGAGMVILRMLEWAGVRDHVMVVTRCMAALLWAATGSAPCKRRYGCIWRVGCAMNAHPACQDGVSEKGSATIWSASS